tara:strand:+ start:550 stop:2487 length:1938 start_codon:yes stop_codon:yes gene_type:complete
MCGYVGVFGKDAKQELLRPSLESIKHRGPDNMDYFFSEYINLGFARLSIQDLSENANQPILNPSKEFIMVFNGEIYNHLSLRKHIKSSQNKTLISRSNSDTITLLALFDELGIEQTLKIIRGMFSIAIYYLKKERLFLIRDHFGQKPLYYKAESNFIFFGSEIKALGILSEKKLVLDKSSLILPLLQSHLPDDNRTLFENIRSVRPGEFVSINDNFECKESSYFEVSDLISEDLYKEISSKKISEVSSQYFDCFENSINQHLISDVPIGTLFSAGLDSSLVASSAEKKGNPYRIGFKTIEGDDNFYYDIFDRNSTGNTDFYIGNEENEISNLPYLLNIYEAINKQDGLILTNLTRRAREKGFKVLLNGDASDELFSGYGYFAEFYNDLEGLESFSSKFNRKVFRRLFPSFANVKYQQNSWINYHNIVPNNIDLLEPYLDLIQYNESRYESWVNAIEKFDFIKSQRDKIMMAFTIDEIKTRLPRYLHRSDSYGMASSVEMRAPFLDIDLVKLAINTPTRLKLSRFSRITNFNLTQKFILKEVAKISKVPREIIYRRKKGTTFKHYSNMKKIVENISLDQAAELLSVSEKRLKNSIVERTASRNYPIESLSRYIYNILCTQVLSEIFVNQSLPSDISKGFKDILKND